MFVSKLFLPKELLVAKKHFRLSKHCTHFDVSIPARNMCGNHMAALKSGFLAASNSLGPFEVVWIGGRFIG